MKDNAQYLLFQIIDRICSVCRKNIAIIPQDPLLFTGTIRENIDPKNHYSDDVLWEILEKVGIKKFIPTLDTIVEDRGSGYSSGQKQLICLARATLTNCKILVLDEATANMDAETDEILHYVIDDLFSSCTILMIAHKLNLVINCDRVLVLNKGEVAEFDEPKILLQREDSLFRKMCQDLNMD